ncbi:MAG: hypothetical protein H0V44_13795 [Planctomycetes bacterium]|nr:hypothetical protein [Planctomycetota bacterium]
MRASIESLRMSSCMSHDDDRWIASQEFTASIKLIVDGGWELVSASHPVFSEIVTDCGEHLAAMQPKDIQVAQGTHTSTCAFTISYPDRPPRTLARMAGTIDVVIASGRSDCARLRPLTDYLRKRVHIGGTPGFDVTLGVKNRSLQVTMDEATDRHLRGIYATTGTNPLRRQSVEARDLEDKTVTRSFTLPARTDSVYLEFYNDLRTVSVPILQTDLPLTAPERFTGQIAAVPLMPGSVADCVLAEAGDGVDVTIGGDSGIGPEIGR